MDVERLSVYSALMKANAGIIEMSKQQPTDPRQATGQPQPSDPTTDSPQPADPQPDSQYQAAQPPEPRQIGQTQKVGIGKRMTEAWNPATQVQRRQSEVNQDYQQQGTLLRQQLKDARAGHSLHGAEGGHPEGLTTKETHAKVTGAEDALHQHLGATPGQVQMTGGQKAVYGIQRGAGVAKKVIPAVAGIGLAGLGIAQAGRGLAGRQMGKYGG